MDGLAWSSRSYLYSSGGLEQLNPRMIRIFAVTPHARTIGITNTTLIIFVELFVNPMRLWRTQYVDRWQAWKIHRLPEILPRGLAQLVGD